MRTALAILGLLLVASVAPSGDAGGDPGDGPGGGDAASGGASSSLGARVSEAMDAAIAYFQERQEGNGSWNNEPGITSLVLLALSRSGVPADDPSMEQGLDWLLRAQRGLAQRGKMDTYTTALVVMLLADVSSSTYEREIHTYAKALARAQCRNGQWSYLVRPGRRPKSGGDNSNMQFAMIAIWSARRAGFDPGERVWRKAYEHLRTTQNDDGGWGYSDKQRRPSCGSMTGAGIAAATIARAGLMGARWRTHPYATDPVVRRGLGWLGEKFAVDENPDVDRGAGRAMREKRDKLIGADFWRLYYLWSVERAMGLLDRERVGDHRWYEEGAERLLAEQKDDGRWVGDSTPDRGTAFALLFLSRGTRPVATEPALSNETVTPRGEK